MRLDNDFDDNMKEATKYAILVCLVLIAIWFVMAIVKLVMPDEDKIQKDMIKGEEPNIEKTLSELVDETSVNHDLTFDDNKVQVKNAGDKNFTLYISELPNDIYFSKLYSSEKQMAQKRAIVNQKVGENYIDSVLSYGTLVRWNPDSFPLKVYIKLGEGVPEFHLNEIKNAFQRWEDTTDGFISFKYVDKPDNANIICSYPEDFLRSCESNSVSTMAKQYFTYDKDGHILRSNIELTYADCNGEAYARDTLYAVVLREIGHSLGLRGHSGNSNDNILYYPEQNKDYSVRPVINKADLNTLRLIYSINPDKIDKALSPEQKKKLIKADDVWGEKTERFAESEKAMLYNLEMSPDIPDLYVALANYYKENEDYDKAITAYSRSIVLMSNAEFKSKVYARVGDTYNLQDRYTEAVEAYKLSLKNLTNKHSLFDVYFNLGVIYYKQGKLNDSIVNFQNALRYVSDRENSYRLLVNLTELYLKIGNYINAVKCAEKAYSIRKTDSTIFLLAYSKYKNSEFAEAQAILEEGLTKESSARTYAILAQIYYDTQQFKELENLAETVKTVFPGKEIFTFK